MAYEKSTTEARSSSISASNTVPVVDFSRFLLDSDADKRAIAREIDEAFRKVGFVYLQNHGIQEQRVDECFEWVRVTSPVIPSEWTAHNISLANVQDLPRAKDSSLSPKASRSLRPIHLVAHITAATRVWASRRSRRMCSKRRSSPH